VKSTPSMFVAVLLFAFALIALIIGGAGVFVLSQSIALESGMLGEAHYQVCPSSEPDACISFSGYSLAGGTIVFLVMGAALIAFGYWQMRRLKNDRSYG